jgi:hypothetical protein
VSQFLWFISVRVESTEGRYFINNNEITALIIKPLVLIFFYKDDGFGIV